MNRHRHFAVRLCCLLLLAVSGAGLGAQECDARVIGKGPRSGGASGAVVVGDTAYVTLNRSSSFGTSSGQLQVVDVGDPERPAVLGYRSTPGEAYAIAVARGHAYVADGEAGLTVFDVADPGEPRLLRSIATPGRANRVAVVGSFAYVSVIPIDPLPGPSSLEIFSLDDPRVPRSVGSLEMPEYAGGVWVEDGRAYVATGGAGVVVVDVTDPAAPVAVRTIDTPGGASDVTLWEGHAFVADGLAGLTVVDLQSPDDAMPVSIRAPGAPDEVPYSGIRVSEGVAYVHGTSQRPTREGWSGILIFDVADPARIEPLAIFEDPSVPQVRDLAGGLVYVGGRSSGLRIGRLEERSRLAFLGAVEPLLGGERVAVEGSTAIVYGYSEDLDVIDVRRPERPAYPVRLDLEPLGVSGHIASVVLSGGLAHVSAESGLSILDMTAPLSPALVGFVEAPPGFLVLEDGIAYLSSMADGLLIVDVSVPGDPEILSSTPLVRGSELLPPRIAVASGYLYATSSSGPSPPFTSLLEILDVRDPRSPSPGQILSWSSPYEDIGNVVISDGFAYVDDAPTILIFDLADPAAPRQIGSLGSWPAPEVLFTSFTADAGRAYVSFTDGAAYHLAVYDVEDPTREARLDTVELDWHGASIALSEGLAFIPTGLYGVHIVDVSSCAPVSARFRRGDANGDASIDLSDAAYTLNWLFTGGPMPPCLAAANANGDAAVDISDATYSLGHLFLGGPPPAEPFEECGAGTLPADGALGCAAPPAACRR